MAIVNLKSDLYRDELAGGQVPDFMQVSGRLYQAVGTLTNGSGDSAGSTYRICDVPSDAILTTLCAFDVENWGFADVRIGTLEDVDALVSAARVDAVTQLPVLFGVNHTQRAWEHLGLAADPGGHIPLYAHAVADATGAGSMPFRVVWAYN